MHAHLHAAHRPLMHSVHIAPWLKIASCVSSHPCMRTCGWCLELSVFFLVFLVFYLVSLFYFQSFLMSTSASNERSMSNPLCDSSLGSVVTSDYVTPLTLLIALTICHVVVQCSTFTTVSVTLQICLQYLMVDTASCYKNDGREVCWLVLSLSFLSCGQSDRCTGVESISSHSSN